MDKTTKRLLDRCVDALQSAYDGDGLNTNEAYCVKVALNAVKDALGPTRNVKEDDDWVLTIE